MTVVRWSRAEAIRSRDSFSIDELGAATVPVLDGVTAADDDALLWCRRAPCPVIAVDASDAPPGTVDLVLGEDDDALPRLADVVAAHRLASRALVTVLRSAADLAVSSALVVESLAYSMLLAGPDFAGWLDRQPVRSPRIFETDPVQVVRDGDHVVITLTRPENRNAFSAAMRDALFEALAFVETDTTVARVTLRGDGPSFSSGGDLTEFGTAADPASAHEVRLQRSVGALVARLAPRVVVEVHGPCVGAGVELSAFAGHVIAHPDTTFLLPEIAMGLIPGAGGTVSIARRIGRQATARLALLGEPIGVDDALRLGLIDAIDDRA